MATLQLKAQRLEAEIGERGKRRISCCQALQETEAALRLREEFLSTAAHELRNPLTALSLHAQLAQQRLTREGDIEPPRIGQALAAIVGQAERLSALVDRLLDASCLSAGQLELRSRQVDLVGLVEKVAAQMAGARRDHQITVATPAHVAALVDPVRIELGVGQSVDNAIKFSRRDDDRDRAAGSWFRNG